MTDYVFYEIQFHYQIYIWNRILEESLSYNFRQKNINIMLNGKLGIRKQHEFPNTYD